MSVTSETHPVKRKNLFFSTTLNLTHQIQYIKSNKETSSRDEAKDWEGICIPPQSAPDKATSLRLLRGAPFGLKTEILNHQGRLIT
jgi:hypothetical protein